MRIWKKILTKLFKTRNIKFKIKMTRFKKKSNN